ncbi:MAG: response regulator, partial [Pontibacterium sp.]
AGYKVSHSGTAAGGLKEVMASKPSLVLIDLTLPDMSALYVINQLNERASLKQTRVIALADQADQEQIMDAVKAGITHLIIKPIVSQTLLSKVQSVLD